MATPWRSVAKVSVAALAVAFAAWYLVFAFRWSEVLPLLARAQLAWLLVGSGLTIVAYWLLRSLRFSLLFAGTRLPFGVVYLAHATALSLATVTPAQAGEAIKIELLKRAGGVERLPGYGTFVAERGLDALALLLIAAVAGPWLFRVQGASVLLLAAVTGGLLVAIGLVLLAIPPVRRWLVALGRQLLEVYANGRRVLGAVALTAGAWSLVAAGWWFGLRATGIRLGPLETLGLMALIAWLNLATFVPAGLGVAEVGTVELLERLAVPAPRAQAGALLLRAYGLLILLLGLVHWWAWRRRSEPDGGPR